MSRDYELVTFTTTWGGVPDVALLIMFSCYPWLMFLPSPWLEIYRFSNWSFADFDQFKVNIHFANFGQVKIDPICSLLLTLDRSVISPVWAIHATKNNPLMKFQNHTQDLTQVIFNDAISRNQELISLVNK